MVKSAYTRSLETMYALRRFGIKLGLGTIRRILDALGTPHRGFNTIHVAGTNGKGSVAVGIATVLAEAGYKTGLYTSPHLVRFNERIRINDRPISDTAVVKAFRAVRRVHHGDREPTFFEFSTAMAFYEFGRRAVEWAVIETGMGGRLDATNIINPAVSVITNVSLEHREYLGDRLAQIAAEKAGIIKPAVPVVTGVHQPQALSVIAATARCRKAPLFRSRRDFHVRRQPRGTFTYRGLDHVWPELSTGLRGAHQVENAALTLAACELLIRRGVRISRDHVARGLARIHWPGRLQVVCEKPLVLLDGAHNLIAARGLARYLADHLAGRPLTLVVGILEDKPYAAMLRALLPRCSRVVLTRARIERALPPEKLYRIARGRVADITIIEAVSDAVAHALQTASPDAAVCIAGSLYVVGEAIEALASGRIRLPRSAAGGRLRPIRA